MARKIFMVLLWGIIAVGVLLAAAGVVVFLAERAETAGRNENFQIRTETEPIYSLFPELPKTSDIQWRSWISGGIGPTTVKLYFFAFYDYDVSNELQEMKLENQGKYIELYFVPDSIDKDEKWRLVENAGNAFQTGIKDTKKMYANVYVNDAGTILYIEAIGD